MIADASTGAVRTIFTDRDQAWLDFMEEFAWCEKGQALVWLSERDGCRHAYFVPHNGGVPRLLTPGNFDVIGLETVDEKNGWLYFTASPENPAQRYLYRSRLDGKGKAMRVTPAIQSGTHS